MKKILVFLLAVSCPLVAIADDAGTDTKNDNWILNVRRIGLDWSQTRVQNAAEYINSPISALNATSQDYIKGVFDTVLEYTKNKFSWDNCIWRNIALGRKNRHPYNTRD